MRKRVTFLFSLSTAALIATSTVAAPQSVVLRPQPPIEVSASPARFDLMSVDGARHRLLAAHSQVGTLTVVDLAHNKLEGDVTVGKSSGVAIDQPDNKYFVGTERGVAVVDRQTLRKTEFIATDGPADAMVFDPHDDRLFVGHDDGKELWVVDPRQDKVVGRIAIPGAPELMAVDPQSHRLYVNIKPANEVVAIEPRTGKILARGSTLPTASPHGMALDSTGRRLFVAGHARTLSVFALPDGKSIAHTDIGPGHVDQIAFDASAKRLYCPSSGRLVVVNVSGGAAKVVGSVSISNGTHSVAVDPATHWVWVAYAKGHQSYVQAFAPVAGRD